MTVGPTSLVPRRLYSSCAIALALALFGLVKQTADEVRQQVSTWKIVHEGRGWRSLRRWIGAAHQIFARPCAQPSSADLRSHAERWAHLLAGDHAGDPLARAHRAFFAVLQMV